MRTHHPFRSREMEPAAALAPVPPEEEVVVDPVLLKACVQCGEKGWAKQKQGHQVRCPNCQLKKRQEAAAARQRAAKQRRLAALEQAHLSAPKLVMHMSTDERKHLLSHGDALKGFAASRGRSAPRLAVVGGRWPQSAPGRRSAWLATARSASNRAETVLDRQTAFF